MSLGFVNDMRKEACGYISLFAEDATLLGKIRSHKECEEVNNYINNIYEWSRIWEIEFFAKK